MQCAFAQAESHAIFLAHGWRWAGLDTQPRDWNRTATALFPCFERGLMVRLRLNTIDLARAAELRRLLAGEPIVDVAFEGARAELFSPVAIRTLVPYRHSIHLSVSPGVPDAFLASLLSSPVMASASKLVLDGVNSSGLSGWLAKSPFLRRLRSLSLKGNRFTDAEARELACAANLERLAQLDLSGNVIGEIGRAALAARYGSALVL